MIEFIEKVEKLKLGSRKVSEEILLRLNWSYKISWDSWESQNKEKLLSGKQSITESLNAAYSIIQNGWGIANLWEAAHPKDRPWWGCSLRRDEPHMVVTSIGASTPELAICGAILRVEMEESLKKLADLGQEIENE